MIGGFNTNIRHRGVLYHVQTEDSGRANPHIITHLYYHGTILASEKSTYRDRLDAADLDREVRALMERQHKDMLKRLRVGQFDAQIDARLGHAAAPSPDTTGSETQPGFEAEPSADAPEGAAPGDSGRGGRIFGEGILSDKPLDEVVLEYLVDNARKRRRRGA